MNTFITRMVLRNWTNFSRNTTLIPIRSASISQPKLQKDEVKITFIKANGQRIETHAKTGDTFLDVVVNNHLDIEGYGACEGTLTCSTCHLIFTKKDYDRLPNEPSDEENDMLDLAHELSETSRLGCQITLTKEFDGIEVKLPSSINDARN